MERDDQSHDDVEQSRRRFLAASALGATGLALGSGSAAATSHDGHPEFAVNEHDHSGEYGAASKLGEAAPVDSIRVADLATTDKPMVDVRAHGAVGDGETDDYTAIQDAFDSADDGDAVFFPPGDYRSSGKVTQSGKALSLLGAGMGASTVTFTGDDGGFDLEFPREGGQAPGQCTVQDLSLVTTTAGGGTALDLSWPYFPSVTYTHAVINNVEIRGHIRGSTGWTKGIRLSNAWHSVIDTVPITGAGIDTSEAAIELRERTLSTTVRHSKQWFSRDGILLNGRTEGFRVRDSVFVATGNGVRSGPDQERIPLFVMDNCHGNSKYSLVDLERIGQPLISGNDLWTIFRSAPNSTDPVVRLTDCSDGNVSDNVLLGADGGVEITDSERMHVGTNSIRAGNSNVGVRVEESDTVQVVDNTIRNAETGVAGSKLYNSIVSRNTFDTENDIEIREGLNNVVSDNLSRQLVQYLVRQDVNNNVPEGAFDGGAEGLPENDTYGQTFTVEQGFPKVEVLTANFGNDGSKATLTLYEGSPGSGLAEITSERRDWKNNKHMTFDFSTDSGGTYYLEMSNPEKTPTWWWHEGADGLRDVGGSAYVNREAVPDTNFCFWVYR